MTATTAYEKRCQDEDEADRLSLVKARQAKEDRVEANNLTLFLLRKGI